MGRGKACEEDENVILARYWIYASEDSVAGSDQPDEVFFHKMYRHFVEKGPTPGLVLEDNTATAHPRASGNTSLNSPPMCTTSLSRCVRYVRATPPA